MANALGTDMHSTQVAKLEEFLQYLDKLKVGPNRFMNGFRISIRSVIDLHFDLSQNHDLPYLITSRYFPFGSIKSYSTFWKVFEEYLTKISMHSWKHKLKKECARGSVRSRKRVLKKVCSQVLKWVIKGDRKSPKTPKLCTSSCQGFKKPETMTRLSRFATKSWISRWKMISLFIAKWFV